jgi:hypothetical protein
MLVAVSKRAPSAGLGEATTAGLEDAAAEPETSASPDFDSGDRHGSSSSNSELWCEPHEVGALLAM